MFDYKNASKEELKSEYKRIADKVGDDQFFTRKELNYLPQVLMDDEQVIAFSSGMMDGNTWLVVLTNIRIIFLDKGMLFGLKQTAIPLGKINSISGKTGIIFGTISIADGSSTHNITNVPKKTVKPFTNLVENEIRNYASGNTDNRKNVSSNDDDMDKIRKLSELMRDGIITEDEFNKKKKMLLGL
jgi:hypothetical protein